MPASQKFIQVYDTLPPDAQELLVQKHLVPLLDIVSKDTRNRTATFVTGMQHRYARMPSLHLKAKKAEIATLMLELSRDSKRGVVKERSCREQLLSEAIESFTYWLNDVWRVAFEFRTNFRLVHTCLLFACDAIDQIGNACGGCRCSYSNIYVPLKITKSSGKIVKSFSFVGAHKLERILLWIWRDLFMSILATGTTRQKNAISDMIDDIRVLLGPRALDQLLRGGSTTDSDDDGDQDQFVDGDSADPTMVIDDDGDDDYISDDCSSTSNGLYPKSFYASHWPWHMADQQPKLRNLIHTALLKIFKVAPTGPLYDSMMSIADDQEELQEELDPFVMAVAGYSSENLSAALRIMALNHRAENIHTLLKAHSHLLRPQDAVSLQLAVLIMASQSRYRAHVVSIIEEELLDVTKVFHAAIRFCFCNIDSEINKIELTQILTLARDSLNRRSRIERWVKGITTPHTDTANPMAFAALMMGIPLPPGLEGTEEGDMLGYFDMDGDDPEVEDLREEFRPNIKGRFQIWTDTARDVKGGPALLLKAYTKLIAEMPFLRASDIMEEMSKRLSDRPCKAHVADALDAMKEFCEQQSAIVATKRRTHHASTSPDAFPTAASGSGSATAAPPRRPVAPQPTPLPASFPIEDVD